MQIPTRLSRQGPGRPDVEPIALPRPVFPASLVAGLVLLALFAGLTSIALRDHFFVPAMDRQIARFSDWVLPGSLPAVATYIASVASVFNMGIITLLLAAWLATRRRWPSLALALAAFTAVLLIEASIRIHPGNLPSSPADVFSLVAGRGGWSETYPSGHTARIGLAAVLYPALVSSRLRPSWLAGAVILGLIIGIQRVQIGDHSGDEVVGGLLLGWGVAALAIALLPAVLRRERAAALARVPSVEPG